MAERELLRRRLFSSKGNSNGPLISPLTLLLRSQSQKNSSNPTLICPPSDEGLLFSSPRPSPVGAPDGSPHPPCTPTVATPARPWKFLAVAARLEAVAATRPEPQLPWGPPRAGEPSSRLASKSHARTVDPPRTRTGDQPRLAPESRSA
jgi:hypothetical protein